MRKVLSAQEILRDSRASKIKGNVRKECLMNDRLKLNEVKPTPMNQKFGRSYDAFYDVYNNNSNNNNNSPR